MFFLITVTMCRVVHFQWTPGPCQDVAYCSLWGIGHGVCALGRGCAVKTAGGQETGRTLTLSERWGLRQVNAARGTGVGALTFGVQLPSGQVRPMPHNHTLDMVHASTVVRAGSCHVLPLVL